MSGQQLSQWVERHDAGHVAHQNIASLGDPYGRWSRKFLRPLS